MKSLLFVYNAKSDYWSKKIDFAHKIISPSTYSCSLCALTHGNWGKTEVWKAFRIDSDVKMEFIYKNDFQKEHPNYHCEFPIILEREKKSSNLSVVLNNNQLSNLDTVENLITAIKTTF